MYTQIDKKLVSMSNELISKMHKYGAINNNNEIIDEKKFNFLIDTAISYCETFLSTTEQNGSVSDKYSFNLILSQINILKDMKTQKSVCPYTLKDEKITQKIEIKSTPVFFQKIITKIFGHPGMIR